MDLERLFIGVLGAVVGVIGWLFVGLFIQHRAVERNARQAARAVYFELAANHLNIYLALEFGAFGTLSRSTFDRLLPELAAWIPVDELQAISVAYLGHAGYEQASSAEAIPAGVRRQSLLAVHDAHRTAVRLLRGRSFSEAETERLTTHLRPDLLRLMDAADAAPAAEHQAESSTGMTHARS